MACFIDSLIIRGLVQGVCGCVEMSGFVHVSATLPVWQLLPNLPAGRVYPAFVKRWDHHNQSQTVFRVESLTKAVSWLDWILGWRPSQ